VVGERIRELGRQRPDVAPDPAEVVEQARARRRKLGEEAGETEDVDDRMFIALRSGASRGRKHRITIKGGQGS
jgi:hypothetical protein